MKNINWHKRPLLQDFIRPEDLEKETPQRLPKDLIDTLLNNNKPIKKCFLSERSRNKELPNNVKIIFTVGSSGVVKSMYITSGKYVGSVFEVCLRSALKQLSFPPFEGEDQVNKHTFRIK